jgi:hypothetical protein
MIPELLKIISGFASCYPKFLNQIRVSGISGSGIPGSGFGLWVFCPPLSVIVESGVQPSAASVTMILRAGLVDM